tara:strand:+ start:2388 stop:2549 length:162 start_codon:yes stop_codon:yes gene_type:complete
LHVWKARQKNEAYCENYDIQRKLNKATRELNDLRLDYIDVTRKLIKLIVNEND